MGSWLGVSAVNPALLWGTLLVASPIIIHLLSKRRFKIIEWAAMDFLLEADKKNRRRVQLEHLILLLLRCLAIVLLALMAARLFLQPTGLAAYAVQSVQFERVVVLDDSYSMGQRVGNSSVFAKARDGLKRFADRLAEEGRGDTLSLVLTSRPDKPVFAGQYLRGGMLAEVQRQIGLCEVSDSSGNLVETMTVLDQQFGEKSRGSVNRILYLVSDFRAADWISGQSADPAGALPTAVTKVARQTQGLVLVDVGEEEAANLALAGLAPAEGQQVVETVPARFVATVANRGREEATEVPVEFAVGDLQPQRSIIRSILPGRTAAVEFYFTFRERGSVAVRADLAADRLPGDDRRFASVRATEGVSLLIVNGEPSADRFEDEVTYLERALNPLGETFSGNRPVVVTENQFEGMNLDPFQAVFLCNLYRIGEERVIALARFVQNGGGLVIFPGDQVDIGNFNDQLYQDGKGLSPILLEDIRGDDTEKKWVAPASDSYTHPLLRLFEGAQDTLLKRVKIFRYFQAKPAPAKPPTVQAVLVASLSDAERSPLIVERPFGKGRVVAFTTTCDREWTVWPNDPSYAVTMLELARYVAKPAAGEGNFRVGEPLTVPLDPSQHEQEATLRTPQFPEDAEHRLQAGLKEEGGGLALTYDQAARSGVYRLNLTRRDGTPETLSLAVNVNPDEGKLERIAIEDLRRALPGVDFQYVRGAEALSESAGGARSEVWKTLLAAALIVLAAEQALAWHFGRSR